MSGSPGLSGPARAVIAAQKSAEGSRSSTAQRASSSRAVHSSVCGSRKDQVQLHDSAPLQNDRAEHRRGLASATNPAVRLRNHDRPPVVRRPRPARHPSTRPEPGDGCPTSSSPGLVSPLWRTMPRPKSVEPPCTDLYARWCRRGGAARTPLSRLFASACRPLDTAGLPAFMPCRHCRAALNELASCAC